MRRISPTATTATHEHFCVLDTALITGKAADSSKNERLREIHTLHTGNADNLQRMLNALQPSSYIRPHRHVSMPKPETVLLLQGKLGFIVFDDDGSVSESGFVLLDRGIGNIGIDYRSGTWHTFFALVPDTVIFEVKPGPYDALTDKELAPWAPDERDPSRSHYLGALEDRFRKQLGLTARVW